mmetsp:Transcript_10967/g.21889  ORF Transcript_10967/g.21889 Transcript_10967/m.21889 type:complete len:167 (-) Transcript_10967:29-529(-)
MSGETLNGSPSEGIHSGGRPVGDSDETILRGETDTTAQDGNDEPAGNLGGSSDLGSREQMKITYADYRHFSNRVVLFLRSREEQRQSLRGSALSRKDIVRYLLEYMEGSGSHFESEASLRQEAKRLRLVVNRMVKKDRILIELPNQDSSLPKDDRLVAVHPNYVLS